MRSKYRLYPSASQTNILSCQGQEPGHALSRCSGHSLHVEGEDFEYKSFGGKNGIPSSTSDGSLIDFDIDTSDFMNMNSPFPWDDNQCAYRYTDPYYLVRYSFESSSSTIQGSYCSMKTSLPPETNEASVGPDQSRESTLIPDFPHDLADHHIQACKSWPANLRTSSRDSAIYALSTKSSRPSYKRSVTPSQLDSLAGALEVMSARRTYTSQRSLESSYTQDRPITPSLSFSSTVTSSPASSIMSPRTDSENILATAFTAVSSTGGAKIRSNARSSDQGPVASGSKQVQRKISGPLPNAEYPSMMNLNISPFSAEIYNSEGAFQPCRKTPKPPSSIPLLLSPGTSTMQAEPPSWFDLDDDTGDHSSKRRNIPTKLGIPHLRLRADSSSKKTMPGPALTIKRRSEDSITIAANIVETTDFGKSCATSKVAAPHISLPSLAPTLARNKAPQATLKKKSSFRSKILVPARSCKTETLKRKKSRKVKVRSSNKSKNKRSPGWGFRACFRRLFG
jgi:hypothetical protein